jgi:DNA ligase-associated metallophosphoesterase
MNTGSFEFLPEKAIWWPSKATLVVSDVHIGKAAHFRKSGIAIPSAVNDDNLRRLNFLLTKLKPERMLILGDLVHSTRNKEWDDFVAFRLSFRQLDFTLVKGNHDVLPEHAFHSAEIHTRPTLEEEGFFFSHEPLSSVQQPLLNVCGHLHPAVMLKGNARQRVKLSCFWLSKSHLVLPAFGSFTGSSVIKPLLSDRVFAVVDNKVVEV